MLPHHVPIITTITAQGITMGMAAIAMAGDVTVGDKRPSGLLEVELTAYRDSAFIEIPAQPLIS